MSQIGLQYRGDVSNHCNHRQHVRKQPTACISEVEGVLKKCRDCKWNKFERQTMLINQMQNSVSNLLCSRETYFICNKPAAEVYIGELQTMFEVMSTTFSVVNCIWAISN
jgi:hypothetical protein